ncbi:membrane-spanning 4-domains subfamily A member 8 [Phodopus roborovskii]|uniref:Ms4a8 protein n=1 Tax=Phodopus roborovskii TaxID=109678 RepID=A0AAU9ZP20_PHORO|nr:membrane-spanning 4-domains subfamily A member 8 [Phodopus roborovskii]CAH6793765.1 Ms4a8 [Phodopus roborovskii]
MKSVPSPGSMANSVYVVAPHNAYPEVPGARSQVPLYPNNQAQIHVIPGNPPISVPAQKVLKNGKVLGAIQILIGLVHIGVGSIMFTNLFGYYTPVSLYGGFPFWGGIWFIISGSLSVAAENQPNSPCLMNGSVGLNIFSAICSAVGVILFITDMSISGTYIYPSDYPYYDNRVSDTGMAISGVLLIFCLLELCIASVLSHFGCQVACCQYNNVDVVIPNIYATTNTVIFPEPSNQIPRYSSVVQNSR